MQKKIIIAYVPVLHEGYRLFLEKNKNAKELYIFGKEIITQFDHLAKEIRALDPVIMKKLIRALGIIPKVSVLKLSGLRRLNNSKFEIVLPDEDVTREIAEKYLTKASAVYAPVFLRWDKHNSLADKPVNTDQKISFAKFDQDLIKKLRTVSQKRSSDWWRRIGAAIVKNGKVILIGYNRNVPSPHTPYANGDPRNNFHRGDHIESSTALHAEAGLISAAARKGISLKGSSIYISTFPCPSCAKLVAYSGISKLYYTGGYAVLDSDSVLKSKNVEIIFVDLKK